MSGWKFGNTACDECNSTKFLHSDGRGTRKCALRHEIHLKTYSLSTVEDILACACTHVRTYVLRLEPFAPCRHEPRLQRSATCMHVPGPNPSRKGPFHHACAHVPRPKPGAPCTHVPSPSQLRHAYTCQDLCHVRHACTCQDQRQVHHPCVCQVLSHFQHACTRQDINHIHHACTCFHHACTWQDLLKVHQPGGVLRQPLLRTGCTRTAGACRPVQRPKCKRQRPDAKGQATEWTWPRRILPRRGRQPSSGLRLIEPLR